MLKLDQISTSKKPWFLSTKNEKNPVSISPENAEKLKNYGIMCVDFLYKSFQQKLMGVVLNEEHDMNSQLQVSLFLEILSKSYNQKGLALIISPESNIPTWIYYLNVFGGFKTKIITGDMCPDEFIDDTDVALILPFKEISLISSLEEYIFICTIIDNFDTIVHKRGIKKVRGNFNIGVSNRNFYENPDQKTQFAMLDWCHTGCVGKLKDFYDIDNDNFGSMRDNYRFWWFRVTWKFSDDFLRPTEKEKYDFEKKMKKWLNENGYSDLETKLEAEDIKPRPKRKRKIKNEDILAVQEEINEDIPVKIEEKREIPCQSSDDTIIMEQELVSDFKIEENSHEKVVPNIVSNSCDNVSKYDIKNEGEDDILLSIIGTNKKVKESSQILPETEIKCEKSSVENNCCTDDSSDFFKSLFSSQRSNNSYHKIEEST